MLFRLKKHLNGEESLLVGRNNCALCQVTWIYGLHQYEGQPLKPTRERGQPTHRLGDECFETLIYTQSTA